MIDEGLVGLLAADAGVAAATATGGAGSIFQTVTPPDQSDYPCLAYKFVGGKSFPTADTRGFQRARVQIDCWGTTGSAAKKLGAAVLNALDGYRGTLGDGTVVSRIVALNQGTDIFSDDSLYFGRMLEFYVMFTPA